MSSWLRANDDILTGGNDPSGVPPFVWWFGGDQGAGAYPIGPNGPWTTAGGISAVTRATSLISDPLAQVEWVSQAENTVGSAPTEVEQAPRWVRDPMLLRPDLRSGPQVWPHTVRLPRAAFWAQVIRAALWWGEGNVIYVEGPDGAPVAGSLYLLARDGYERTKPPGERAQMTIGDDITVDDDGRFRVGAVGWRVATLRHPHSPISPEGRSFGVFEMNPSTFTFVDRMQRYAANTFRTGVPAGYLKSVAPGLTQPQADDLKGKWLAAHGGDTRSIAVLNSTTEFNPIAMSPVDTALAQMHGVSLVDVANAFGVDPNMIGGPSGDSSTYANVESKYSHYRVHTLGRWQTDLVETFGALLPAGRTLRIQLDQLLRADTATRYTQYAAALAGGWLTTDEIRDAEGLPPLPKKPVPPQLQAAPVDPATQPAPLSVVPPPEASNA